MARPAPGDDGVGVLRGEDLLLVGVGDGALVHREEARAHLHALGAERERGRDAAPVGDAARADDRDGDRIGDRRQKGHRGELADVPARFRALGHDGVGAQAFHADRERGRCDDGDDLDARFLPHLHVVGGASGARGDDVDLQLDEQFRELGGVGVHEHDVRAERLARDLARGFDLLAHPGQGSTAARDDAEAARLAHRAREARVGDARHRTLNDGHVDAQKLRNTRFHVVDSFREVPEGRRPRARCSRAGAPYRFNVSW